jgi:hypothetical protein
MTEPTNTDKARYVVERTGGCWHERKDRYIKNDQGKDVLRMTPYCRDCGNTVYDITGSLIESRPTFLDPAGRIQLLELMMRREDAYWFLCKIGPIACDSIHISYLIQEGLLLDAAYQFLKEKEKDNEI